MNCPVCGHGESRVAWTRGHDDRIVRARDCPKCGARFQTAEVSVETLRRARDLEDAYRAMGQAVGE